MTTKTPFNIALQTMFPRIPGIIKGSAELLARVKPGTIREWRRGNRKPPQWAIELLLAELHKQNARTSHAIALLQAQKEKGAG